MSKKNQWLNLVCLNKGIQTKKKMKKKKKKRE